MDFDLSLKSCKIVIIISKEFVPWKYIYGKVVNHQKIHPLMYITLAIQYSTIEVFKETFKYNYIVMRQLYLCDQINCILIILNY